MKITRFMKKPPNYSIPCFMIACALSGLAGSSMNAAVPVINAEDGEFVEQDDTISLEAYNVTADRIEDFGLRVGWETYSGKQANLATMWFSTYAPRILAVLPNTAATRAGLQPGERILKSEGRSTVGGLFSTGKFGAWKKIQKNKWAKVAAGKKDVTWTLEIESPKTKVVRTVKLVVPTPTPHWGSAVWHQPEDRSPSIVPETGPLADCSRAILDHGIWTMVAVGLVAPRILETYFGDMIPPDEAPNGYEWHIGGGREGRHQMLVTQFRGQTDILLHAGSALSGHHTYLTSPSGVLTKAWRWARGKLTELSADEARVGFEHEVDLWSTKVMSGSGRWPFEVVPGHDPNAIFAVLAETEGKPVKVVAPPLAAEFLKLRSANEAERMLFTDAYNKLGAESDHWAYTESSHGIEDNRLLMTRVDPSQPKGEHCVLLSIDGKPPTVAETQQWRDDDGDTVKPLGEVPHLTEIVNLQDLRILKNEGAAIVFEAPMKADNPDFPAERFQALFHVNKDCRGFEAITVKLRNTFRVAGVVKVTEAGFEMHFQLLEKDKVNIPQPVWLKVGGGGRLLFMKMSHSVEATRTNFQRVEPYIGPN